MSTRKTLMASSLAALLGAGLLFGAPAVHATGSIGDVWSQIAYPTSLSDDAALTLQGFCALCHVRDGESAGPTNPYGAAILNACRDLTGGGQCTTEALLLAAFAAVEGDNSDGDPDGFINIAEINADAQPGWTEGDTVPSSLVGELLDPVPSAADIDVVPVVIDFGSVLVGTRVTGTEVIINNVGGAVLTVDSLTLVGDPVFSFGLNTPTTPFDVPAGGNQTVGVVYEPDAEGADFGALEIGSNDPDEPLVTVALQGIGITTNEACFPSVDPRELAFGQVIVGTSLELPVTLTNNGIGDCTVDLSVPQCIDGEFVLTSPASVSVGAGETSIITVAYSPINLGQDNCRIDLAIAEASDVTVPMNGEGVDVLPTDLDIKQFKASKSVSLSKGSGIVSMNITIENNGTEEGPGLLTVIGEQNGVAFVHQVVEVRDAIGNGATRITLQSYIPTEAGEILWTATLQDGNPDDDVATATTNVRP